MAPPPHKPRSLSAIMQLAKVAVELGTWPSPPQMNKKGNNANQETVKEASAGRESGGEINCARWSSLTSDRGGSG